MRIGSMTFGAGTAACSMLLLALPLFAGQTVTVPAGWSDTPT
jgi:hypothetical protein